MRSFIFLSIFLFLFSACIRVENPIKEHLQPEIYPDYKSVVIPPNIAPLVFSVKNVKCIAADFIFENKVLFHAVGKGSEGVEIPIKKWKTLLSKSVGSNFYVKVYTQNEDGIWKEYLPFEIAVAKDSIDAYVSYRLIKPGYEQLDLMGLYQRDITTFEEKTIIENSQLESKNNFGCVNCHSFRNYNADSMLYHGRFVDAGTVFIQGDDAKKINFTIEDIGKASYPYWHPNASFIAFSMNETRQVFHVFDESRITAFDYSSDLMIYDYRKNEVIIDTRFIGDDYYETFPSWSPDGKLLYFSRADYCGALPENNDKMRYGIYRASFDVETAKIGDVECIVDEHFTKKSQPFARVSPNGNYLLYTECDYGTFPMSQKDSELKMIDLQTKEPVDMVVVNSDEVEGYNAWSSNGRWIMFGSRRLDGMYSRIFFAYFDENGVAHKPFLMPQKTADFDLLRMKAYNVPEFSKNAVSRSKYQIKRIQAGEAKSINVRYK